MTALRTALKQKWKVNVMNAAGCILRDAFAKVGFGFNKCLDYAPLIHERQVACLWVLELNDDLALAAASAEVSGTGEPPREIPNIAVRVKIVLREVDGATSLGKPLPKLLCSLSMMVPGFEKPCDSAIGEAWLERELLGVHISREGEPEDVAKLAEEAVLSAVSPEKRDALENEAHQLADYVLRGLAP